MQTSLFSLDRNWRFTHSMQSVLPKILTHETIYAFSKGNGAQGAAMLNYDDSTWDEVTLPHDSQHELPFDLTGIPSHGYHPSGICWYRRTFLLDPEDVDAEIQLIFDGISGISDIYFNGAKLLHNESCYNSISLSLSDMANFGVTPNLITVRVDKTTWEGWWYEGCGINRHVWLIKRPRLHISKDGLWVKPTKQENDRWRVDCEFTIANTSTAAMDGMLSAAIVDPSGDEHSVVSLPVSLDSYGQKIYSASFDMQSPSLWDLDTPMLYSLKVSIESVQGTDTTQTRFGFRTIRVDGETGFYLNDRPVKLLGTCNHLDHAGVGSAITRDLWQYRLSMLKEMGSNAFRCSHNPPPPELLDLCDEMGILVMDENRSYSTSPDALHLLRSMVTRDRNHPCVVMYSLFNEEPMQGTAKGRRLALHQMAELKKLDDSRPVLGAFNGGFFEETGAGQCLDITGINYFVDSYDSFHQQFPNQPMLSSESASAFATRGQVHTDVASQVFGNYDEDCADWGQTARDANISVLSRPFVMGLFIWTGFDYRGEPTPYEWPSVSSHFGIMDICGYPKDVYYLYQAFWRKEPCLHILPHWNHPKSKNVRVMAYSNCDEVELFLNEKSLGRQINVLATPPEWNMPFEKGILRAKGYHGEECTATAVRETAGPPIKIVLTSLMPQLYQDTDSVAAITISISDAEGRECPTAKNRVTISVKGGTLLGIGNGDPNCHDPDITNTCRLFHGRSQMIIRANLDADEVIIKASARGLEACELSLAVGTRPSPPALLPTSMRSIEGWRMSHVAQETRPDPSVILSTNDMNSMEPISFEGVPQSILTGRSNMYCLYETKVEIGLPNAKRFFIIGRARGFIEVFVNNQLLGSKHCFIDERVELVIPPTLHGVCRFTIIVQNRTVDKRAGILDPITLVIAP